MVHGIYSVRGYGKIRQALMEHTGHVSEALDRARQIFAEKFRAAREKLRALALRAEDLCREVNLYNGNMPAEYANAHMERAGSTANGSDLHTAVAKVRDLLQTQRENIDLDRVIQLLLMDINNRLTHLEQNTVSGGTEKDLAGLGFKDCEHFCELLEHDVPEYIHPTEKRRDDGQAEASGNVVTNSIRGTVAGLSSVLGKFLKLLSHVGEHPKKTIHDLIKGSLGIFALGYGNNAPSQGNIAFELIKVVGAVDTLEKHGFKNLARWLIEVAGNMAIMVAKPTPLLQEAVKRLSETLSPDQLREEIGTRREGTELVKHGFRQYAGLAFQSFFASIPVIAKTMAEKAIDVTSDYMPVMDRLGIGRKILRWDLDRQQTNAQKERDQRFSEHPDILRPYEKLSASVLEITIRMEWAKYTITHEETDDQKALDRFAILCNFWEQVRVLDHLEKEIRTREHRKELLEIDDYLPMIRLTAHAAHEKGKWGQLNKWQFGKAMQNCIRRPRVLNYAKKPAVIETAPGIQRIVIIDEEGKAKALLYEDIGMFYAGQLSAGKKPYILPFADEPRAVIAEALLGIRLSEEQRQTLHRVASDTQSSAEKRILQLCAVFSPGQLLGAVNDHSFPGLIAAGIAGPIELSSETMTTVRKLCRERNRNANGNVKNAAQ